jgi:LmbE family N-acetylglucosaminyl deacetylase
MPGADADCINRHPSQALSRAVVLVFSILMAAIRASGGGVPQVFTDKTAYDVGQEVSIAIASVSGQEVQPASEFRVTLRYAGDPKPVLYHVDLAKPASGAASTAYRELWKIPEDARTGRYEIDLEQAGVPSGQEGHELRDVASFSVYRKLVETSRIQLEKTFYTSGDPVGCGVTLSNLARHPMDHLRVEFSDRYWPWIGAPATRVASTIRPLAEDLALPAGESKQISSANCGVASEVKEPSIHQYGVVVWDHDRKNIYDISFSQLVFIRPRGSNAPTPYPGQFVYPELSKVDTTDYRQFYPPELNSGAIRFDTTHTMFPTGGEAEIHFALSNPTDAPWRGVKVLTRWLAPDGTELARNATAKPLDLIPGVDPTPGTATFKLPAAAGLYRARVQVTNTFGQILATNDLEMAADPLPHSILIFCAHQDDEGGWSGLTRAAIENHIPIHYVYFTSGDAGSCDRYYEHSCRPAEAQNFGELREEETRASLGHLGVPREDIFFLGLPDGGSGEIWYDHPDPSQPYLSVLLASDHSPYADAAVPNLPYARQSVVEAAEQFITRFKPAVIVTAHPPQQTHIDHIVNNYFVVKALQNLLLKNSFTPPVQVLVNRVYDPKDNPPTPYHYEDRTFYISGEAATLAQESWWFYESQGGNGAQGRIKDFDKLPRAVSYRVVLDWMDHEGWNEHRSPAGSAGH